MKFSAFLIVAAAALALPTAVDAVSGKGKPGYCADSTACAATYTCVSVQTTRSGVTDVKQCLPMNAGNAVCTGIAPGLCPSFSTTWGTAFRDISSVCSYISPASKCAAADATNSTKGTVDCLNVQSPSDETKTIGVIYGCVDFDGSRLLFEANSDSDKLAKQFNYTAIIADKCMNPKNPAGSNFVCSSQGTCSPTSAASMDYGCACNVGFSGKYCEKIENNKCYNDGVCGGGSCDLKTNECTNCTLGTMGDKCAQCDPTYDATKVCSGQGTCAAAAGSASSSSSSGSTTPATTTKTPAATTAKPSATSDSSYSGNAAVSLPEDSSSSGATAATLRFLATTSSVYQCTCSTGYSGTQCDVKLKANSSSSSSTTTAPSTGSGAGSLATSVAGVAIAAVVASFNM